MDKYDPNTWTESYVSSNRAECLSFIKETNSLVVNYIRQKNYSAAIAGLDRILNGLVVMQNGRCGDFRSHIAMFSLCEASIAAFGTFGPNAPETRRRGTALKLFEDALDFSRSEATKEILRDIISALKSGAPLARIKEEYDPDFPQSAIDNLTDLQGRLSTVSPSAAASTPRKSDSGSSSGGCYVATAVYGSYDCRQVWTLRRYRDDVLASTWYGRAFIRVYYSVSPVLVRWFGQNDWFRNLWKSKLDRMVNRLNANGIANTPYEDKEW